MTDDAAIIADWLDRRAGKVTSSRMADAMAFKQEKAPTIRWVCESCDGKNDAKKFPADLCRHCRTERPKPPTPEPMMCRTDYLRELLSERHTGHTARHYVTPEMQWGLDYQSEAAEVYEIATGNIIQTWPGMFFEHPDIADFGASTDGLIGSDGVAEIKCPTTSKFLAWRLDGGVPEEHKPQMLAEIACTGRRWCEFIAYDPRIRDERLRLFVRRYEPTTEEIAKVEAAAVQFLSELERAWDLLTTQAA